MLAKLPGLTSHRLCRSSQGCAASGTSAPRRLQAASCSASAEVRAVLAWTSGDVPCAEFQPTCSGASCSAVRTRGGSACHAVCRVQQRSGGGVQRGLPARLLLAVLGSVTQRVHALRRANAQARARAHLLRVTVGREPAAPRTKELAGTRRAAMMRKRQSHRSVLATLHFAHHGPVSNGNEPLNCRLWRSTCTLSNSRSYQMCP